jgi:hypothetical protein
VLNVNCASIGQIKGKKPLCIRSFFIGACVALVLAPVAKDLAVRSGSALGIQALARQRVAAAEARRAKAEPWGRIEAFELPFANPTGAYPDRGTRLQPPRWFFENASERSVERFIKSCDLPRFQKKVLLDKQYWTISTNGCTITPPHQLIWFLSPHSREQIYTVLGKWPVNYPQALPFHFSDKGFELRFQKSGLSQDKVKVIERLSYRKWGELCFSDLEAAADLLEPAEFQTLLEALYAIPAYGLRLRVDPDSDVAALVNYWGKGGREKQVAPLLTALSKIPGGEAINIVSVLPAFARMRLYTFPDAWNGGAPINEDCFYSALNFFNEREDTNLLSPPYIQEVLDTKYAPTKDNPSFGDLMVFLNPEAQPVHVCVYIADSFVFTKNGMGSGQPWVLMRLPDVLPTYFAPGKPGRMLCLRQKGPSPV